MKRAHQIVEGVNARSFIKIMLRVTDSILGFLDFLGKIIPSRLSHDIPTMRNCHWHRNQSCAISVISVDCITEQLRVKGPANENKCLVAMVVVTILSREDILKNSCGAAISVINRHN